MTKTMIQRSAEAWVYSGSIPASGSVTSGSIPCKGYGRIVGLIASSASSESASGLQIRQSGDLGQNYDYTTACGLSACSGSAYSIEIVGNAVEIVFKTDSQADEFRSYWHLRPI